MEPVPKTRRRDLNPTEWIAAGIGLVVVVAVASWDVASNGLAAAFIFIGLLAGGFAGVVAHELGHALCAWLVGWRVWIISAAPICWRPGHPPRFTAQLREDVGGFVLATPSTNARDSAWRSIVVTAGGPLASVLCGPLLIAWLATLPREGWETPLGAGLLGAALAFAFYSSVAALFSLWPSRFADGKPNDGRMILAAMFSGRDAIERRAAGWSWTLLDLGVEPSAWPRWMRETLQQTWAPNDPLWLLPAYALALDEHDEPRMRALAFASSDGLARVLRGHVLAYLDADMSAAELELAAATQWRDVLPVQRLRALTLARIHAAAGEREHATRIFSDLADDIADAPTPEPFWQALLVQAKASAAAPPRPRQHAHAAGPWGARPS